MAWSQESDGGKGPAALWEVWMESEYGKVDGWKTRDGKGRSNDWLCYRDGIKQATSVVMPKQCSGDVSRGGGSP